MFPINFNFPYRKKDGSLITMEKALDGAGADLDLVDLDDIAITDPAEGDGLIYDNTAHKWKNIPIISRIVALFNAWKKNGAYNLCPIDGVTEVKQDVTFTVNSNRTISANGTASGEIYYTVASATFTVDKTGSYKFVGRPSDITGTCNLFVYDAADGGAVLTDSDGTGAIGTLTAGVVYGVSIYVASGVNISNKTFKPLLTTDLNATYDDYVPYAKTNRELTEDKFLDNSSSYTALDTTITTTFTTTADGLYLIAAKCNNATSTADVYLQNGSSPILSVLGVDVITSQLVYLKAGTTLYVRSDKGAYVVRGYYKA